MFDFTCIFLGLCINFPGSYEFLSFYGFPWGGNWWFVVDEIDGEEGSCWVVEFFWVFIGGLWWSVVMDEVDGEEGWWKK